jgi:hypothetical protein
MGIFEAIFSYTVAGKIAKATCAMLNVTRRLNTSISDLEVMFRVIEERFGEGSDITAKIIGNIYFIKFEYDVDDFGEDDVRFGLMDILVYIIYFELGPKAFDDRYIVGKFGKLMREEGFTSKEINGIVYASADFPQEYFNKYVVRRNIDILDLDWRMWM